MRKPLPRLLRILSVALFIELIELLSSGWFWGTLLSGLLTAFALVLVRDGLWVKSRLRGVLTIAWLYWGLSFFSNLIEATVFKVVPLTLAVRSAGIEVLVALTVAWLVEWLTPFAAVPTPPKVMAQGGAAWRIPLLALAFFVIYIAAGIAIQPWIMSFYAHRPLPVSAGVADAPVLSRAARYRMRVPVVSAVGAEPQRPRSGSRRMCLRRCAAGDRCCCRTNTCPGRSALRTDLKWALPASCSAF